MQEMTLPIESSVWQNINTRAIVTVISVSPLKTKGSTMIYSVVFKGSKGGIYSRSLTSFINSYRSIK